MKVTIPQPHMLDNTYVSWHPSNTVQGTLIKWSDDCKNGLVKLPDDGSDGWYHRRVDFVCVPVEKIQEGWG